MQVNCNLILVLDNVRSRVNVGSVFRSADAFGITQLYLCGITPCPPHREIEKTALGATSFVNWKYRSDTKQLLVELQQSGYQICAIEQHAQSVALEQCKFNSEKQYAFVFGNELTGISEFCLDLADKVVEISQYGQKKSLNIAVAVGVSLWAFHRQNS